jgi:hypothetical protein|tara:strand:+ start:445 stop:594 length:150 start_codon:yes stop_codon:yes gene_type:complete
MDQGSNCSPRKREAMGYSYGGEVKKKAKGMKVGGPVKMAKGGCAVRGMK